VADAVEAARQHVQEKAADELGGVEHYGPEPVAAFDSIVLPLEGDARLVERDEARVGDGEPVGVAREIGEHGFRPGDANLWLCLRVKQCMPISAISQMRRSKRG
jgi:hypothetical protein